MMKMNRQRPISLLIHAHVLLAARAWSAGPGRPIAGPAIAKYGGLLANAAGSLGSSAGDVGGECAVTPEIPVAATLTNEPSDPPPPLSRKPRAGDVATFTLLRFEPSGDDDDDGDGEPLVLEPLFDTSGTLQLVLDGGNYLPGIHQLLSTMIPGETVEGASIDAGYGGYNPELVFRISASDVGKSIDASLVEVGTVLRMGNGMKCRVTEMSDENWTLDANHVLAGASYDIDVRLERVEEGPSIWDYAKEVPSEEKYRVATFALGCFWGGELAYQRVPGVISTHVGYTQGQKADPTYEEVCTGTTGHTEAIRVIYNPREVPYESLVRLGLERLGDDVYKLNQVGNDRGTQYRHGIYYHDDDQRKIAEEVLQGYGSSGREVMTELKEAKVFYVAEEYHQQYLLKGGQSAKKGASQNIRCYG